MESITDQAARLINEKYSYLSAAKRDGLIDRLLDWGMETLAEAA